MAGEFKEKVNQLVSKMVKSDDGNWSLPEDDAKDLDEPTLFAVTAERRVRDTQGSYTRAKQEAKRNEAIADSLQERILESDATLTKEQRLELTALKTSDPDAWRTKLNEFEAAAKDTLKTELNEIRTTSSDKSETEVREEQMAAWSESTGLTLTQEVVDNDLPPRFTKALKSGNLTWEDFLTKAGEFLKAEKVIKDADGGDNTNEPDLGKAPGGNKPSDQAQNGDFEETYDEVVF